MLPLSIILLLVCIGLATYYFFLLRQRYQYFSRLGIPTPPFHYFFGHFKTLWSSESFSRQLQSWTKEYGKIYGIYQGTVPTFVVSDPDFLQEVFVKQSVFFPGRKDFFTGGKIQNVFTSSGAKWRRHRHVLNPTFSAAKLKLMSPLINGCITNAMEKIVDHVTSESEFNIYTYYKRMTMDVICRCAFGLDTDLQNNPNNMYFKKVEELFGAGVKSTFFYKLLQVLPQARRVHGKIFDSINTVRAFINVRLLPQLNAIYILCNNRSQYQEWTQKWIKIKGIHMDISLICKALQLVIRQYNHDSIAVSLIPVSEDNSSINLNQLDPSFMYTQIFKKILLEMEHSEQSIKEFVRFWRLNYINNTLKLNDIDEFERDYHSQGAITWYTREYFIYQMLNHALRTLEGATLINMGFFVRDLHQQIEQLHRRQINTYHGKPFTVYRGQGLSKADFEKLVKMNGGLLSFNNFLSTSKYEDVSLGFAAGALTGTDMVGILFRMTIDPSISSAPFAYIQEASRFQEEEILFSMHTIFRVGEIAKIDDGSSIYLVDLRLTADDDQELRTLTKCIQKELGGATGWTRLGMLLMKLNQWNKAEELYNMLLNQTSDLDGKASCYSNIGYIKDHQADYEMAVKYYEKALEIFEKTLPINYVNLSTSYNNIGLVYKNMGEYPKALSFFEKALEINQKTLPTNHPLSASSYNNVGLVYCSMGEYSKSLSFYAKALEIKENTLPANHPDLAIFYDNIGLVYKNMGEYSKSLSFYNKALQINEKTLPANHLDLAISYNNIGGAYNNIGAYSKALSFYNKALEIWQKTLPADHPSLATSYNNIAAVYNTMEEYSKALSSFEKALQIIQKTLPANHPTLAASYCNIGSVSNNMGEHSKALSFYNKALEVWQKTLPANHPSLATSYNNIGGVYNNMGEYSKALHFYEKAFDMRRKTLPATHPSLATSYNNVGVGYKNMGEHAKALSCFEHALQIWQTSLPSNHPYIISVQRNLEYVKEKLKAIV